ncbi:MAG: serine hydrolase [Candidatus Levybacteria bacterium]|nr:serine hydrolase [Candidatus Levybacteria bacterium]
MNRTVWFLAAIFAAAISVYFVFTQFDKDKSVNKIRLINPLGQNNKGNSLSDAVEGSLRETKGTYGIAVKHLKTGESYYFNKRKIFEAGSLYKLWVMAVVFNKIQAGEWSEDQILSEDVKVLNEKFYIEPDLAEQTEGTVTLSVHDALEQMITVSQNYAALLLTEKVKLSSVKAFLETNGFNESKVGIDGSQPTVSPSDMELFFEKLYKQSLLFSSEERKVELANKENTDKMLSLLKRQRLNTKLPKYLPKGTIIAHKTGEIGWFTHDAGIVYLPGGDYIIAVLSESSSPIGAQDRIAEVSKAVYEYFKNKYR